MNNKRPIIGITLGDPAGIGPEIVLKALKHKEIYEKCKPIVIGNLSVINKIASIINFEKEIKILKEIKEYSDDFLNLINIGKNMDYEFGKVQKECGKLALEFVKKGVELAIENKINGLVTAPISKEAISLSYHPFSGHTEFIANLTKCKDYAMMLIGKKLKVIHLSTHLPLKKACEFVKKERVYKIIKLAEKAMKDLGIEKPRIAVAGLNPHASENGLFGDEEIKEIVPAIEKARKEDIQVYGPFSPDTVFLKCINGDFDIVVAMYHDQGHIPLKLLDFFEGVNITIGLPIVRTSVDHGTAFDIAGKGIANERSMLNAIILAAEITKRKIS